MTATSTPATSRSLTASVQTVAQVARPWSPSIRTSDLVGLFAGNGLLIIGMWVRHGGLDGLGSAGGALTAAGQLSALLGTYLALVQLVLMARVPWIERVVGQDALTGAHRWLGFLTVWLIGGHAVTTTLGYALTAQASIADQVVDFLAAYPFVPAAVVGLGLFGLVAVTSVRAARRRLGWETWWGLHLMAYLGVALAGAHQFLVGADFEHDPLARAYWLALYALAALAILGFRIGEPLLRTLRHGFRVANVIPEAPGVVSVYLEGRHLEAYPARSGQYVVARFLTRDGWWRGHPFSLSAAPNGRWLRLTIKDLGDDTHRYQRLRIGTRVHLEGPYGRLTGEVRRRRRVLLVAAGIGIAPLRALLEDLPAEPGDLVLVYRVAEPRDVVFGRELETLERVRGVEVHVVPGHRGRTLEADPLAPDRLASLVPDVAQRDVFVCGPEGCMDRVVASLARLGLPGRQLHRESFTP